MFDSFRFEYGITRNHKIICLIINLSNNQYQAVILCLDEGSYLPAQHADLRETNFSLMTIGKKILQDIENSPKFCDSVTGISTKKIVAWN
jgi:hypothetical protein